MTLTFGPGTAAADWIVDSDLPWHRLVTFGPAGFEAYARLRLLPDPAWPGQSENDAEAEDWRDGQLPRLFEVLAAHTTTADDCYFCVWEGFGAASTVSPAAFPAPEVEVKADARPGLAPRDGSPEVPHVEVPNRAYFLYRGPLSEAGNWDTATGSTLRTRFDRAEPAFVWPADRAWCVAHDVDPHWAGIGGAASLIDRLVADDRLDVVAADPGDDQPFYR